MYEDWEVESSVFPASGRIFTIASAGTTSMALSARGLAITAVDINPAQTEYVRARLTGGPTRQGTADRLFAFCRAMYPLVGISRARLLEFLQLDDPPRQTRFWREHLDTGRLRLGLRLLINRLSLQAIYHRQFLQIMPGRFDRVMTARFERCFGRHPNRSNPYAWRLLAGADPPGAAPVVPVPEHIHLVTADAAAFLEQSPPGWFDGFSLSNILDGTDAAYGNRLMSAVRKSARPGARVVLRSFGEPSPSESMEWVERDRSMLWGVVRVETI
jgi:S-adenosylmethionine:diacylglycerol 3-amino-3-carboxypropyl transferase